MTDKEKARREKISATLKKRYAEDPEYEKRLGRATRTRWDKPGSRESMSAIMKERNPMHDEEARKKHVEVCASQEYRDKLRDVQKVSWMDDDRRIRGLEACKALWENKEIQKRKSENMRVNNPMFDPEVYEHWYERITDPGVRKAMSDGQRKSWSLGNHISRPSSWRYVYGNDWDNIRLTAFRRDSFRCYVCREKSGRLSIHHIVPYHISKNNSDGLLITLCNVCHTVTERAFYRICERGEFREAYVGNEPNMVILIQAGWEALKYTKTIRKEQRLAELAEATVYDAATSAPAAEGIGHLEQYDIVRHSVETRRVRDKELVCN